MNKRSPMCILNDIEKYQLDLIRKKKEIICVENEIKNLQSELAFSAREGSD